MTALTNIIGLAILYFLTIRIADVLAARNKYNYYLHRYPVLEFQEIVVNGFAIILMILAAIVGLTA